MISKFFLMTLTILFLHYLKVIGSELLSKRLCSCKKLHFYFYCILFTPK